MNSLGSAPTPEPFALKSQYIPEICPAGPDADREGQGAEEGDQQEPVSKKKRKAKVLFLRPDGQPWNYAGIRREFIIKQTSQGIKYKEAAAKWQTSDEKRLYLKDVPLKELKRRKFVGKDVATHPWAD